MASRKPPGAAVAGWRRRTARAPARRTEPACLDVAARPPTALFDVKPRIFRILLAEQRNAADAQQPPLILRSGSCVRLIASVSRTRPSGNGNRARQLMAFAGPSEGKQLFVDRVLAQAAIYGVASSARQNGTCCRG